MKVIQVVPDIENMSAGPAYSVPAMTEGLRRNGVEVELYSLGSAGGRRFKFPVRLFKEKWFSHGSGFSPDMSRAFATAARSVDIIHANSIWQFPSVYPSWAVKHSKCKFVLGPRGTLSQWALNRSRIKKFFFGHLFQYPAMRRVDMFVASCLEEAEDIRRLGYKQPIAIIPNGVDMPETCQAPSLSRRRMFFLSRIHPKKNVEMLINCWSQLEMDFPDWDLSIVGPDKNNAYADKMKKLVAELNCKRITFEGELKGSDRDKFIMDSECEVLPTHSENFGMVVAEALACGRPVLCSKGAPWSGLIDNHCGWWVEASQTEFLGAMSDVMSQSREMLLSMGANGRLWMAKEYDWVAIGAKMKTAYAWLLGEGDRPEWVMVE